MDYEITDYITPQEYMEMRKLVEWSEFPLEQAEEGIKHSAHLVVFRKDGKVIGLARVLTDYGYVVYIADVIVRPDFQGKGIGRELMKSALAVARKHGKSYAELYVDKEKDWLVAWYSSLGFEIVKIDAHEYTMLKHLDDDKE